MFALGLEREVKLRVPHSDFTEALGSLGLKYELMDPDFQEDIYLDFDDCRLMLSDFALRVRISSGVTWITYKGPKRLECGEKVREEVEGPLGSEECEIILRIFGIYKECPKDLMSLLEDMKKVGLRESVRVRKRRRELRVNRLPLRIYLDHVEGLGEFVEVEGEGSMELIRRMGMSCMVVIPSYAHLIHVLRSFNNSRPL
ncbi:MAG: CYTH domain-containing protein [Candidatus Korarchaeum sp.]|nr:CYTH domain-containing protein [Candidatus Korarchaeum sp.]MDW8035016.1 CYTH domain-containing protein [Candidatus Korarchaeum sp.]